MAEHFPGARIVKANHTVAELIRDIGFGPLGTGDLSHGGRRQEPDTPVYNTDLTLRQARQALID